MTPRVYHYWGPSGREDGNSKGLLVAMERMGLDVWHFCCHGDPRLFGYADLHVEVDWAADVYLPKEEWVPPRPSFFWCSDTHWSEKSMNYRIEHARKFDQVAVNIRRDVEIFHSQGIKAFWLPYATDPYVYQPFDVPRDKYDWCFVGYFGQVEKRVDWLDTLVKASRDRRVSGHTTQRMEFYIGGGFYSEEVARVYRQSKVVMNHCMTDEVNQRVFEALATESFLLTSHVSTLHDLGLEDGVHLATFKSNDEAVDKLKFYLKEPDARARIARAGRKAVLNNHTHVHRANEILTGFGLVKVPCSTQDLGKVALPKEMWLEEWR